MKNKKNNNGFTLIELISVVLIISVLSVYAFGQFNFSSGFSQKAVYDKLRAGLEYASKAAVAQRHYVCVCIGPSCATANSATFTVDTRAPESAGATFCDGTQVSNLTLPSADSDCGGANNAVCSRSGATIGAASLTSFMFNAQGQAVNAAGAFVYPGITVTGENNISTSNCSSSAVSVCVNGPTGYVQ